MALLQLTERYPSFPGWGSFWASDVSCNSESFMASSFPHPTSFPFILGDKIVSKIVASSYFSVEKENDGNIVSICVVLI